MLFVWAANQQGALVPSKHTNFGDAQTNVTPATCCTLSGPRRRHALALPLPPPPLPGRQKFHTKPPPPLFAAGLNTQSMHCTRLGLLDQVIHSDLKVSSTQQEEELELELVEALGWENAPTVACFMCWAGNSLLRYRQ